ARPGRATGTTPPPAPAVPAIRSALRDVLLAPKAQRTVPAAARPHHDVCSVVKHTRSVRPRGPCNAYPSSSPLGLDDAYEAALAARPELDLAVAASEDRVIAPDSRSGAGTEARSALADQNHPGRDLLAGAKLHAEHLRVRVAAVARRAKSLLVRHLLSHLVRRRVLRLRRRLSLGCARRLLLCGYLLVGRLLRARGCPPRGRLRA